METTSLTQKSPLTGTQVKAVRKVRKLTAEQFAKELGYTRAYIKSIEGGSLKPSAKFIERFFDYIVRENLVEPRLERPRSTVIISKHKLPVRITMEARPRRCRHCREWYVFAWQNQRICTNCKRTANVRRSPRMI